jgi:hypothetical protein
MNTNFLDLSDAQLINEVSRLSRCEREATACLIAHLAEFDARRLYLGAGFPSLFLYCTEVLRLSEHEAYNRIEAARTVRRFPRILDMLAEGSLNLTAVRLLAPHLTADNCAELLEGASGGAKRDVEQLLARHFPRPDVRDSIRKVPVRPAAAGLESVEPTAPVEPMAPEDPPASPLDPPGAAGAAMVPVGVASGIPAPTEIGVSGVGREASPSSARRDLVRPLAEDRYEVRFTASAETCKKLRLAKDLLRHSVPNGDTAEVIDRALTALLEDLARKKIGATPRPRPGGQRTGRLGTRHIPAQVKRAVWIRDGGRCAFVGTGNHRCPERGFLEFHHVRPHAVGGRATVDNIQVRCRAHNAYEGELYFGPGVREGWEPAGRDGAEKGGAIGAQLVPERVASPRKASRSVKAMNSR